MIGSRSDHAREIAGRRFHASLILASACLAGAFATDCSLFVATDGLSGTGTGTGTGTVNEDAAADAGTSDVQVANDGEIVATGQSGLFGLARFKTSLYWTSANGVSSCPLERCGTPSIVASGAKATAIAVLSRVYWITPGEKGVSFTTDDGGVAKLELYAPGRWVAAGTRSVFVVEDNSAFVTLQGDPPSGDSSFIGFDADPERVAAGDDTLAWTGTNPARVAFCGRNGCDATSSVVATNEDATAIALDGSLLFWTTVDGRIRAASHDGTKITAAARDVLAGLAEPVAIAPDESSPILYFAERGTAAGNYLDGTVGKVLKNGGPKTVIARGQARPVNLVVTDTHVYWANEYDGTIRRAPK